MGTFLVARLVDYEGAAVVMVCGSIEAARLYIWEQHAAAEAEDRHVYNDGWLIQSCIIGASPFTIETYNVHHTWF